MLAFADVIKNPQQHKVGTRSYLRDGRSQAGRLPSCTLLPGCSRAWFCSWFAPAVCSFPQMIIRKSDVLIQEHKKLCEHPDFTTARFSAERFASRLKLYRELLSKVLGPQGTRQAVLRLA